jgi:hypothetical protein
MAKNRDSLRERFLPRAAERSGGGCCRPYTPAFRCARLLSCWQLATAGNGALGRWGLSLLANGSLPRATIRLASRSCRPQTPLSAALSLLCRRHAIAGDEALGRWGLPLPRPRFPLRPAFVLQTARYRGQRNAWQVGAAAPTLLLSPELCLSCRRIATAGNKMLSNLRAHLRTRIATMLGIAK